MLRGGEEVRMTSKQSNSFKVSACATPPGNCDARQHENIPARFKTTTSLTNTHYQSGAVLHLAVIYLLAETDRRCVSELWAWSLFKDKQSKPTERRRLIAAAGLLTGSKQGCIFHASLVNKSGHVSLVYQYMSAPLVFITQAEMLL